MKIGTLALCAALALTVAVLSGCGGSSGNAAADKTELTPTTPAAKGPLAKVTWNLPAGEPASLDYSHDWDASSGNTVLANLCDNLMRQEPDGSIAPAIAESVETPNPTTYVYNIRPGVTFTDGSPVTATDVAYSLQRQMDPKTASYWAIWFEHVASIKVTGKSQVTVKMTEPDVIFAAMMATPAGAVVEQKYVEEEGSAFGTPKGGVMCSGPYSLASWTPGKSIVLQANPDYWDASLKPKVKTIEFSFIRNESAIVNALSTGSIDGTWRVPVNGLRRLEGGSTGRVYRNGGTRVSYLSMASFDGALKDPKVRLALQQSIDYKGISEGIFRGAAEAVAAAATPATWGYSKPIFEAGYDELPAAEMDQKKAEKLLAEAGGAPSQPIVIGYDSSDETAAAVLSAVKDSAGKIGLNVTLKGLPTSTYNSIFYDPKARQGLDAFYGNSTPDVADPLETYLQVMPSGPYNYTGYDNPGFTKPMEEAAAQPDQDKRAELITKAQLSAGNMVQIFLPIASVYETVFLKNGVTGVPVSTLSSLYYPWAATLGSS